MRFALTQETSLSRKQSSTIDQLSDMLSNLLTEKNYGEDIKYIFIGVITIDAESEHFFKVRPAEYIDFKIIKDGIGNPVEISKKLGWDIKPDYEMLKNAIDQDLQSIIAKAILESFNNLKLPKKIKDFDLLGFKNDLSKFFMDSKLL